MRISELLATAATSALALVDPRDLDATTRKYYQAGTAATTALAISADSQELKGMAKPFRCVAQAGAAAAGWWAASGRFDRVDTAVHEWIESRGTRHPRRWMAAGTGALMIGSFLLDRAAERVASQAQWERDLHLLDDEPVFEPVNTPVRAVVEKLLPTAVAGSEVLAAQLNVATQAVYGPPFTGVLFDVPENTTRLVPHDQTWSVFGSFRHQGVEHQAHLLISEGRLAELLLTPVELDAKMPEFDSISDWPKLADITVTVTVTVEDSRPMP